MLGLIFAVIFGLSLLPGRKPLCLRFAEKISGGIMPEGAEKYCRRLTWIWLFVLISGTFLTALIHSWPALFISPALFFLTFAIELPIRRRRFGVVFHTSGSTGKSKRIPKTFEMLAKEVQFHRDWYRKNYPEFANPHSITFLGTVQWDHMYGTLWMKMLPPALGARVEKAVIESPEELIAKMTVAKHVFLITTPSFLEHLVKYADQYELPRNCLEIITSGSRLSEALAAKVKDIFGLKPRQIYGSTETGGIASLREGELAEVFEPVKVATIGNRLLVKKSPFSFRNPYLMGDAVEMEKGAHAFKLLGRVDRLVKIKEERVNLAEMEDKVRALGFADAALVALQGTHGLELALVVASAPVPPLKMREKLLKIFPKGTVPKKFRFVAEIPKNAQGKVLKSEIEQMF